MTAKQQAGGTGWRGQFEKNAFLILSFLIAIALFLFTRSPVAAAAVLALSAGVKLAKEKEPALLVKVHEKKILYLAIGALVLLAVILRSQVGFSEVLAMAAAACAFLSLLIESVVNAELKPNATGWMKESKEMIIAIATAIAVFGGMMLVLNTNYPLDAVVSCSMLPNLERGDIVILQGATVNAPVVQVGQAEWQQAKQAGALHKVCGICVDAMGERPCVLDAVRRTEVNASQAAFECGWCEKKDPATGQATQAPCTKAIRLGGETIPTSRQNDIVVYEPHADDVFARSGSIIHRVQAIANVSGTLYYFTKGDNNPQFDVQVIDPATGQTNEPSEKERVHGKVIARLPFLGYFKLFLSGMMGAPAGCGTVLSG